MEIEGTEPYIVGGHTASGYWIDDSRRTTVEGLFAAGDVAGGCPQKYVTGALAEAEIAAEAAIVYETDASYNNLPSEDQFFNENSKEKQGEYETHLMLSGEKNSILTADQLEEAMQKIMDEYAGGITVGYQYNQTGLSLADSKIRKLQKLVDTLAAEDTDELMRIYEIRERLIVCRAVITHLQARKETRWHSFAENADYPKEEDTWLKFVNSRMDKNGNIEIIARELEDRVISKW